MLDLFHLEAENVPDVSPSQASMNNDTDIPSLIVNSKRTGVANSCDGYNRLGKQSFAYDIMFVLKRNSICHL